MKTILLAVLFLFFPLVFFAQTLTGLWIGAVHNDSTTIRKDQSFEIVLTQYKNKVYGFSRSTFVVHDSLFYIVKRVKGTIEGDICEVKDDEVVSYNFHGRLDKGVKMVSTFRFDHQDSVWRMDGDWKTNKTKKYYSVSGKIALTQEKDLDKSKIFPHLEELRLTDDVAFYKESKKVSEPIAIAKQPGADKPQDKTIQEEKPAQPQAKESKSGSIAQTKLPEIKDKTTATEKRDEKKDNAVIVQTKTEPIAEKQTGSTIQKQSIAKEEKAPPKPVKETQTESIVQNRPAVNGPSKEHALVEEKKMAAAVVTKKDSPVAVPAKSSVVVQTNPAIAEAKKQPAVKEEQPVAGKSEPIVITKPAEQNKEATIETPKVENKTKEIAPVATVGQNPDKQKPVSVFSDVKPANVTTAAVFVTERKVAAPQVVNYKSDSLELVLYDNGEVDGDTVSLLLNGEIILAKQGLKASAIKKTIYLTPGTDNETTLVLYAENLGKYPPNTGLLIVHDGDDSYQIRFSADLQQNAAVIFKRKKN
jgi:hypothetical protein